MFRKEEKVSPLFPSSSCAAVQIELEESYLQLASKRSMRALKSLMVGLEGIIQ
jgi:hypothetical protein